MQTPYLLTLKPDLLTVHRPDESWPWFTVEAFQCSGRDAAERRRNLAAVGDLLRHSFRLQGLAVEVHNVTEKHKPAE